MKIKTNYLWLLAFVVTAFMFTSCEDDEPNEPEIVDYSAIKTQNWRDNIGEEFEVDGVVSREDGITTLLVNKDHYFIDAIPPENDYLFLNLSEELNENEALDFDDYIGQTIKIKGRCAANVNPTIVNSAALLGDQTLATLVLESLTNIEIISPTPVLPIITYYDICQRLPVVCEQIFGQEDKIALLYSGGIRSGAAYTRYWNDMKMMYNILLSEGYQENRIVVVYKNGFGDDMDIPVDYAATKEGLESAFEDLGELATTSTKMFLMMNNHGGGNDTYRPTSFPNSGVADTDGDELGADDNFDEQFFYYNSTDVLSDDFMAAKIDELGIGSLIAVIKPCYSGGMIDDLSGPNRVIMTSGTEGQVTWSHTSGLFGEFTYHFFAAVSGQDPITGAAVNADLNSDGKISMYEAQVYILANDARDEQPQYDDDGDRLGTSSPNSTGIGASTFL